MFREMRRKNQALSMEENIAILKNATSGVLALLGDDGYPYTLPISHLYHDGKLYFHCATVGHKIEAIKNCDKASFCVVQQDVVVPEHYTTHYRSVIAFGHIRIIDSADEQLKFIAELGRRFSPESNTETLMKEINDSMGHFFVLEMDIEHISGKEAKELMLERKK